MHKPPTLPDSPTFHLKTFLQTKSQLEIAGHFLGARLEDTAAAGLDQVALIGLDAEQWEFGEHDITELGISVLVPSTVDRSADTHNAIDLVRETKNYHVRVKENAHKINQHFVGGYPENFEFGTTVFLSKLETGEFLRDSFQQVDPGTGRPRPVILVGHAVHNDIEMMKAHFNIDLEREANIVGTLDSQVLAVGARYASFSRPISLANLLAKFDIKEDFLHNAGNDIACTMLATFVTALEGLRQSGKILEEEYEGVVAGMAEKYDELKKHSKQVSLPPYGDMSFCTRCDGTGHFHGTCTAANVFCYACRTDSHMAAKCLEADDEGAGIPVDKEQVPVPCEFCVMNNDPAVYTMAYYHWTKDCLRSKI